jgi:hypothetical protein
MTPYWFSSGAVAFHFPVRLESEALIRYTDVLVFGFGRE